MSRDHVYYFYSSRNLVCEQCHQSFESIASVEDVFNKIQLETQEKFCTDSNGNEIKMNNIPDEIRDKIAYSIYDQGNKICYRCSGDKFENKNIIMKFLMLVILMK